MENKWKNISRYIVLTHEQQRILPVAFIIWKQKLLMMRLSVLIGCCQGFQRPESGIGS